MKKYLFCLLLIVFIIGNCFTAFGEIISRDTFPFDEFEQENDYYRGDNMTPDKYEISFQKDYQESYIRLGLRMDFAVLGDSNIPSLPQLFAICPKPDTNYPESVYWFPIESMTFRFDNTMFRFPLATEEGGASSTPIIEPYKDFLVNLYEADPETVAIILAWSGTEVVYEGEEIKDFFQKLQHAAQLIYNSNIWSLHQSVVDNHYAQQTMMWYPMEIIVSVD